MVIDETVATIRRFVVLPDYTDAAVALWCAFVHAHDLFQHSPRLVVRSPEKRCGKTTLLNLLLKLVPRPLPCSNITGPALFRTIELAGPTLLIDEADTFLGDQDDLRFNNYVGLATAHQVAGDDDTAADMFLHALEERPNAHWVHRMLAPALFAAGREAEARVSLDALMAAYPDITIKKMKDAMPLSQRVLDRMGNQLLELGLPEG